VPGQSALASQAALALADLLDQPLVIFPRRIVPSLYDAIFAMYHAAGHLPQVAQEAIQMQTIVNLVSAGLGMAWVPESVRQFQRPGVVYRSVPGCPIRQASVPGAGVRNQPGLARRQCQSGAGALHGVYRRIDRLKASSCSRCRRAATALCCCCRSDGVSSRCSILRWAISPALLQRAPWLASQLAMICLSEGWRPWVPALRRPPSAEGMAGAMRRRIARRPCPRIRRRVFRRPILGCCCGAAVAIEHARLARDRHAAAAAVDLARLHDEFFVVAALGCARRL
jgi:hypothetical protein